MMPQPSSMLLLISSLLAALPATSASGLYTKNSPVLQLNQQTYNQLIANSNHTSIVEFYAPWCGHCQNLKPAYEKVAKNLEGLAKVAAVNCDDDANKPFCGQMGIQGFPTLKIVTASKQLGRPLVEDYRGARSAKAIADAVAERIPNHVTRLTDKNLDGWLSENEALPKAILFTNKGTTSALIRALAVDFLGGMKFAQIRNKETEAVEKFGVKQFPTLILLPGDGKEPITYDGELKKKPMVEFLSQAAAPNPDPGPAKAKSRSVDDRAEKLKPAESPDPKVVPEDAKEAKSAQVLVQAPDIDTLPTVEALEAACLTPKSGTCILALLPEQKEADTDLPGPVKEALRSLSEIAHKHSQRKSNLFPFYSVPAINTGAQTLRDSLGLPADDNAEIIVLNGRRGWWSRYDPSKSEDFGIAPVEAWIDAIRLGEGSKEKMPDGIRVVKGGPEKEPEESVEDESVEEESAEESPKQEKEHDEL